MTPLWQLDASALGQAYRAGDTTPFQVVQAHLERLGQVQPALQAMAWVDAEGALQAAAASSARWRDGTPVSALDGVPITVKDNIPVAGMPCRWGSRLFADHVPVQDESPVARLRAGGAVILGKTAVPEFTLQGYTQSPLTGTTRNPWDLALTPGGSSGGAVAALAAGVGALAIGTDGGGSIRRPAGFTGLFGFKPGLGVVPREGGLPEVLPDMEVIGLIARSARDLPLVMTLLAGSPAVDWTTEVATPPALRIAYWPDVAGSPVDPRVSEVCDAAADQWRALGASVAAVDAPMEIQAFNQRAWPVISTTGLAAVLKDCTNLDALTPALADMLCAGRSWRGTDLFEAQARVRALRGALDAVFRDFDLLITPTSAAMPWPATMPCPDTIDGQTVDGRGHAVFTAFANAAGLPAVAVPAGWAAHLPVGLQLVGPRGSDARLLALAALWERSLPARPWLMLAIEPAQLHQRPIECQSP